MLQFFKTVQHNYDVFSMHYSLILVLSGLARVKKHSQGSYDGFTRVILCNVIFIGGTF